METAFKGMGYKVQSHELSHFHDDYGLKTGDDDDEDDDDDDEDDEEGGSESGSSDSEDDRDKI